MDLHQTDVTFALMLDGNAAAGILSEVFTLEMTSNPVECAYCGRVGEIGTLLAFTQAPGMVLRCPTCKDVILRIVRSQDAMYLDLRGAAYVCLKRAVT